MKTTIYFFTAAVSLWMLYGCGTIHEFPDDDPVDPTSVDVGMSLTIAEEAFEASTFTRVSSQNGLDVRYIVEVYPEEAVTRGTESLVQREVVTRTAGETGRLDLRFKLHARRYVFLFWADYVKKGSKQDLYYDTQSLMAVRIRRPYTGCDEGKDAFSGVKEVDLTPYRSQWNVVADQTVEMRRPFAKIEVVTTDIRKFAESREGSTDAASVPAKVKFTYLPSIAEQYNVLTQKPERYSDGETFTSVLSELPEAECTLAYDYLFMNGESTHAAVSFEIYDQNDNLLNKVGNILIPVKRNAHSIVKGEFLTKEFQGGGVGIDDGFDGEITITVPD